MKTLTQSERADFAAFCKAATDRQVMNIIAKERAAKRAAEVEIAEAEALRRGLWMEGEV